MAFVMRAMKNMDRITNLPKKMILLPSHAALHLVMVNMLLQSERLVIKFLLCIVGSLIALHCFGLAIFLFV